MTSSQQGASFRMIHKQDVEAFPFPEPSKLAPSVTKRTLELAQMLQSNKSQPWDEIDDLIFAIYGLDEHDKTVIGDTVKFSGPYRSVRERAERPISVEDSTAFCQYLEEMLQPLFRLTRQLVTVQQVDQDPTWGFQAWRFVTVAMSKQPSTNWKSLVGKLAAEANKTGASRVVVRIPQGGGLLMGILNQRRFWTRSRAWLCSLHIEQNHLDAFPIEAR